VITLLPLFPFFQVVRLPAFLVLGLWFLLQFILGLGTLGAGGSGGIAFWAHVGGFAAGWLMMWVFLRRRRSRA
jgi:membrane associated rhomboid family serine protease